VRIPVRLRLTLAFALVMAVVLACAGVFVQDRLQSNLDHGIDSALRSRAADVGALAQQSDSGLREAQRADRLGRKAQLAQILDAHGHIVDQTSGLPRRPLVAGTVLAQARRGPYTLLNTQLPNQGPVRLLATPVRAQGQRMLVVVGQSLQDRNRALDNLAGVLLVGGPAALLLACVAGYALTGASLRPVDAMRRRAAAISATDLDSRLPPAGGNDELGRLGHTLNEMLARIQASVARERTFVADASHELRSPLAMVRTELELIARDRPTGAQLQEAARSAIEETDRLSRLTDDLLLLTRADHGEAALRTGPQEAAALLARAAERGRRRASGAGPRIEVRDAGDATVLADGDRIAQALDNLVDNALRHATQRVELRAEVRGDRVELHVRDDGPGFPPDFLPHAWERFARADSGRTEGGTGLGLAIVRTVAELHGGETGARNRPEGGADVWISLPAGAAGPLESNGNRTWEAPWPSAASSKPARRPRNTAG
jgi:signal transduction histidine kinase